MSISEKEREILKLFASKIDQNDPSAHNNLAVVYYNKGLYQESIEELKKALEIDPHFTLAKNNLDFIYQKLGYIDKDIGGLEQELELSPQNPEIMKKLAIAYKNTGQFFKALKYFKSYLNLKPDDIEILKNYGITLKAIGFYDDAAEIFKRLKKIENSPEVSRQLGEVYYNLGLLDKSINEFKTIIVNNPNNAELHFLLAFVYGEKGDYEKAKEETKIAVKLNPALANTQPGLGLDFYRHDGYKEFLIETDVTKPDNKFLSHYTMGMVFRNKGLFNEALKEFLTALEFEPDNAIVKKNIGEIYLLKNENEKAIVEYSEALNRDKSSPKMPNDIGVACHRLGRLKEAMSWYLKAVEIDPTYVVAYNNLGIVHYHKGEKEKGKEYFKKAISVDPEYADAYLNLGLIFLQEADYEKAEEYFKKSLELKENYPIASNYLGLLYLNTSRFDDAIHCFKSALKNDPQYSEAYYNLGFAYSRIGKFEEALFFTKKALEINPYYTSNRFKLGIDVYSDKLDVLISRELTHEMEIEKTNEPVLEEENLFENLFTKGEIIEDLNEIQRQAESLYEMGNFDKATEKLHEVIRHQPENKKATILLAKIYRKKKLYGEAIDLLKNIQDDEDALKELIKVFMENGDYFFARMRIELLLEKNPEDIEGLTLYAELQERQGEIDAAIETLEKILNISKKDELLTKFGKLLANAGKIQRAKEILKDVVQRVEDKEAMFLLSKIYYSENNYFDSKNLLEKIIKMDEKNPDYLKLLIKVQFKLFEFESALKTVEFLKKVSFGDSDIYLLEGMIYYRTNQETKAINALEYSISLDENNVNAYKLLASVLLRLGKFERAINIWQEIIKKWPDTEESKEAEEAINATKKLLDISKEV